MHAKIKKCKKLRNLTRVTYSKNDGILGLPSPSDLSVSSALLYPVINLLTKNFFQPKAKKDSLTK